MFGWSNPCQMYTRFENSRRQCYRVTSRPLTTSAQSLTVHSPGTFRQRLSRLRHVAQPASQSHASCCATVTLPQTGLLQGHILTKNSALLALQPSMQVQVLSRNYAQLPELVNPKPKQVNRQPTAATTFSSNRGSLAGGR